LALTVFLLVATRVFPSILRLQGAFTQVRLSEGAATELFSLVDDLDDYLQAHPSIPPSTATNEPFHSGVTLKDVTVRFPGANECALDRVSLQITTGESVAIVGATGAGKSTLADVILGVLRPVSGTVRLSGLAPEEAVARWPGRVAYVPQDVAVLSGTVRENVALGFPDDRIEDSEVWAALERAHLAAFLVDSRNGLDTVVGEHGVRLSGGQRQRLGIARALFTHPDLLVLDEATSALDAETERDITRTLQDIRGKATTVVIAHRLATVRNCSLVVYLEKGRIVSTGTFDEVLRAVPALERQARLLGL
jgi:ABC-type multidrug transport system fused ATPase/permease subunit